MGRGRTQAADRVLYLEKHNRTGAARSVLLGFCAGPALSHFECGRVRTFPARPQSVDLLAEPSRFRVGRARTGRFVRPSVTGGHLEWRRARRRFPRAICLARRKFHSSEPTASIRSGRAAERCYADTALVGLLATDARQEQNTWHNAPRARHWSRENKCALQGDVSSSRSGLR